MIDGNSPKVVLLLLIGIGFVSVEIFFPLLLKRVEVHVMVQTHFAGSRFALDLDLLKYEC